MNNTELWRPLLNQDQRRLRADVYRFIRSFFDDRQVLEVQTPILSSSGNTDPNIESFHLTDNSGQRYLRTSPEFAMKRLLAGGAGSIYELGPVFRQGERGALHNPEFTMLEWYRLDYEHYRLAREVVELLSGLFEQFSGAMPGFKQAEYRSLFEEATGLNPAVVTTDELMQLIRDNDWYHDNLSHADCLDMIFTRAVTDQFSNDTFVAVMNYPAELAALARLDPEQPDWSERFEVFLGPTELANGYHELWDGDELAQRFENENQRRIAGGQLPVAVDSKLIAATEAEPVRCAGVAMGMDRLLMMLSGVQSLDEVMDFTWERA